MKKILVLFVFIFCTFALCSFPAEASVKKVALFGVNLNSTTYTAAVEGFAQKLSETKYKVAYKYAIVKTPLSVLKETSITNPDIQIDVYSPDGDKETVQTIVNSLKENKYDAIIALGTPACVAVKNANINDTPVIFSVVIDPVGLGLVKELHSPGTNFTGAANFISMKQQFSVIKSILPNAKKIGVVKNMGEPQLDFILNDAQKYKDGFGIDELIIIPINALSLSIEDATKETAKATQQLVDKKVDAIFILSGAVTGSQAAKGIIDVANANKIPTVSYNEPPVHLGATAGVVSNLKNVGGRAVDLFIKVLNGTKPTEIPVEMQQFPDIIINLGAAKNAGIDIPQELLDKATTIIE